MKLWMRILKKPYLNLFLSLSLHPINYTIYNEVFLKSSMTSLWWISFPYNVFWNDEKYRPAKPEYISVPLLSRSFLRNKIVPKYGTLFVYAVLSFICSNAHLTDHIPIWYTIHSATYVSAVKITRAPSYWLLMFRECFCMNV